MKSTFLAIALTTTGLGCSGVAFAQDNNQPAPAAQQGQEAEAETVVPPQAPQSSEDLAARSAFLEAQLEAMQAQINELKSQVTKATPTWKGFPQWDDKEAGWSFKPRGRIQFDVAHIENPNDAVATRNLGFNYRARRIRLGAEGTIPGGFGYKLEADFANAGVGFGDVLLTYTPKNAPLTISIGNHETFQSLEQITSSRFTSFIERAQMNDAFSHARRLGASVGFADKSNTFRLNAGIFAAHSIDSSLDNDGWIAAARATYSPPMAGGVIHLGANAQYRDFQSNNGGTASSSVGAPSTNQLARYRARPFLQTTDVRFVDTGSFAAENDYVLGLELAGIFKAFHFAGEAQWVKVNAYEPGSIATGLDGFGGANTALVTDGDPTFFSWYAEVGYFLTGETRGYKNGAWDRTSPLKPFSKGGWGAVQINARYDYLDLTTDKLLFGFNNNFTTGAVAASTGLGRGGKQQGFLASLVWIPESYARFWLQFAHTRVKGGPQAGVVIPVSPDPVTDRDFSVNSVATRFQIDF